MSDLQVNNELFTPGGVMGRKDYFFTCLKVGGLCLVTYAIPVAAAFIPKDVGMYAAYGVYGIANIGLIYFSFINMYKRIRDIRGTSEAQTTSQVLFTIGSIIPLINIGVAMFLIFKKGKVTSPPQYPPQDAPVDYQQAA